MATNKLPVLGDSYITLNRACAHLDGRVVRLCGVLGEEQGRTTVRNGKVVGVMGEGVGEALREVRLQRPLRELLHEKLGHRAQRGDA